MALTPQCANLQTETLNYAFQCALDSATTVLNSNQTVLVDDGLELAFLLLTIVVSLALIKWMLSSNGIEALGTVVNTAMTYTLVVMLLSTWVPVVGGFFNAQMDALANKVSGVVVADGLNRMTSALIVVLKPDQRPQSNCQEVSGVSPDGVPYSNVVCSPKNKSGEASIMDVLLSLPMVLMIWVVKLIAVIFLLMAVVAYVLVIALSMTLFAIGMKLGPILVPWLIWDRTAFLFDGWLRFMLGAGLTKVVAALMATTVAGMLAVVNSIAQFVNVSSPTVVASVDLMAALVLAAISAIAAYLMWQVPSIASGLISGSGGGNVTSWGKNHSGGGLIVTSLGKQVATLPGKGLSFSKDALFPKSKGGE